METRLGSRAKRAAIGIAAVALAWGALVLASPRGGGRPSAVPPPVAPSASAHEIGEAPQAVAFGYVCPVGFDYRAYDDGLFYLPSQPGTPDRTIAPARCFATEMQAAVAGYQPAPLGPDVADVDGVFLTPVSNSVLDQCATAAHRLGFSVPCPTDMPEPAFGVPPVQCARTAFTARPCIGVDGFLIQDGGFAEPTAEAPSGAQATHDAFVAAYRQPPRVYETGTIACVRPRRLGTSHVARSPATLWWCASQEPFTLSAGHTALRWGRGPITYEVAVDGRDALARDLAQAIADRIDYIAG